MPGAALRGYGRAYLSNGGPAWTRKEGQSPSGGYVGTAIKSEYGGKKLSNKSYEKYYKGMI